MRIVLLAEAQAELDDATEWYDNQRAGLGDELLLAVDDALVIIAESPESWPRWPDAPARIPPIRKFVLARFPYAIAYQVHADFICVLGIVHGRRMPLYWIGRGR